MLKFDEQKQMDSVAGALALRGEIEGIVDTICRNGYDAVYFMGIGGTYASGMQTESHVRQMSAIPVYAENAAAYNTSGNKRIGRDSIIVISYVTGSTEEMVEGFAMMIYIN